MLNKKEWTTACFFVLAEKASQSTRAVVQDRTQIMSQELLLK